MSDIKKKYGLSWYAIAIVLMMVMTVTYVSAMWLYHSTYEISGTMTYNDRVNLYSNAGCTQLIPHSYSFGELSSTNKTVWLKNIANDGLPDVLVTFTVSNTTNCNVAITPDSILLSSSAFPIGEQIDIVIELEDTEIPEFTFDLVVESAEQ